MRWSRWAASRMTGRCAFAITCCRERPRMPSDQRLHPSSFLFAIGGHLKNFLLPGLVVLFTAGVSGADWQLWTMAGIVPLAGFALIRSLSYRYRLDEAELVVRTGFVFRNERHIP